MQLMKSKLLKLGTLLGIMFFMCHCGGQSSDGSGNASGPVPVSKFVAEYFFNDGATSCLIDPNLVPSISKGASESELILKNFFDYSENSKLITANLVDAPNFDFEFGPIDISGDYNVNALQLSCTGRYGVSTGDSNDQVLLRCLIEQTDPTQPEDSNASVPSGGCDFLIEKK